MCLCPGSGVYSPAAVQHHGMVVHSKGHASAHQRARQQITKGKEVHNKGQDNARYKGHSNTQ